MSQRLEDIRRSLSAARAAGNQSDAVAGELASIETQLDQLQNDLQFKDLLDRQFTSVTMALRALRDDQRKTADAEDDGRSILDLMRASYVSDDQTKVHMKALSLTAP